MSEKISGITLTVTGPPDLIKIIAAHVRMIAEGAHSVEGLDAVVTFHDDIDQT